jgi:DNA modification methylase
VKTALISEIEIPDRQRVQHAPAHIKDLKSAILSKGFLSPILLSEQPGAAKPFRLIAGMGRLTAVTELAADSTQISFERDLLPLNRIPYVTIGDLSPADLAEAELQENVLRAQLSWQEENDARVLIHKLRTEQNPGQTQRDTAKELAERSGKSSTAEETELRRALVVAEHKANPRVAKAKSLGEAFRAVMDMNTNALRASLIAKGMFKVDHEVHLGDCREVLKRMPDGIFDTILCDPPYGINADEMKKDAGHHYEDSPAYGLEIANFILEEGFRLLKPRGNIFLFCDIDHFVTLREAAKRYAFTPWRCPVIWAKGIDGFAPWGREGFIRTYELVAFFTKGRKGLKSGGPDVKNFPRPGRAERGHAAEKPASLLSHLLDISGDPGDLILDPCCGSGSILEAATQRKMKAICIEKDPTYHTLALSRLAELSAPEQGDRQESSPDVSEDLTEAKLLA